jgi:Tfp pilus assembly protein PilF
MKLDAEQALRLWRAALKADGNSTSLAHSAGSAYITTVELDNALKSLRQAVEILEQLRREIDQ